MLPMELMCVSHQSYQSVTYMIVIYLVIYPLNAHKGTLNALSFERNTMYHYYIFKCILELKRYNQCKLKERSIR